MSAASTHAQTNAVLEAYARTKAWLDDEASDLMSKVPFYFGPLAANAQHDGAKPRRVVWNPGDDGGNPGGRSATLLRVDAPQYRDTLPETLADVQELVTVYCWAGDSAHLAMGDAERDVLQYADARALWDAHHRALRKSCPGLWTWISSSVYRRTDGARHGMSVRSVYAISCSVLDVPFDGNMLVVPAPAGFDITGAVGETVGSSIRKVAP